MHERQPALEPLQSTSQPGSPVGEHSTQPPHGNVAAPAAAQSLNDADMPSGSKEHALIDILTAVQETAYSWDLRSDCVEWASNAADVLGVRNIAQIATGSAYQFMIAPEHINRRRAAFNDAGPNSAAAPVPYHLQYRLMPGGRRSEASVWLDEHGTWIAGPDGKPTTARGVVRVINEHYWAEQQRLLYRSDHDELTGQLNRIRLSEALGAVVTQTESAGGTCAFLIASIKNLADINDTFGFGVGDEVITETGRLISGSLRGGDTLGRYSSNKFGIILNDCGPGGMRVAAERFMKAVRETTITTSACPLSASISIGGVLLPDHADTVQQAIGRALEALDHTRNTRLDRFVAFEPSETRETKRRQNITIADEIVAALDENRMLMALQPIVSTKTHRPELYECLLRMEKPDGTIVSAGDFIEVAEQLGLSSLIDRRTLDLAIDLLKGNPALKLALNVSGLTANDHEWLVALHRLTGGRRALTERLTIEITETAAIEDLDQSIAFVDTLKELGCGVAIDDFGTGYTSFRNLKFLGANMLKIDGSFVKDLLHDAADQVFIKTVVELADAFGMETVAEWVGDDATAALLADAGITYMQGFHFGEPELVNWLDRSMS